MENSGIRELTAAECAAIRKLVETSCANYDKPRKECLPLECGCYMFGKAYTGAFCRYFENAVLPLDPLLVESLTGQAADVKTCPVCNGWFPSSGSRVYCSPACAKKAQRDRSRRWIKARRKMGMDVDK